jgi:transcriptional regulator with XRE-family HTH domain
VLDAKNDVSDQKDDDSTVITAAQLRAARALLGMDQRTLADAAGLSVPTIQRMEASEGVIRANVDSLVKLIGTSFFQRAQSLDLP